MSDDSSVVLFWWSTSGHEVFPWTPQLRDEDRANVMLFSLKNPAQPVRLGYVRTHTDPIGFRYCKDALISISLRNSEILFSIKHFLVFSLDD